MALRNTINDLPKIISNHSSIRTINKYTTQHLHPNIMLKIAESQVSEMKDKPEALGVDELVSVRPTDTRLRSRRSLSVSS